MAKAAVSRKAGRRARVAPEQVREQILDVFSRKAQAVGLRAVMMGELATELRVSASTLYKQFPSKEALTLACVQVRLTPEEALAGATRFAAKALGLQDEIGTLEAGKAADLAVWDIERPAELCYWLGKPLLARRYVGGRPL